ncbi:acyltransferase family protein [Candidatus Pantoea soli]|uniref:Acyltransferase 3 domain-containing protein n=1 Tax=Candidatus Pantoea soli TaxID=3098669 RepID=A0A518XDF5_9GAMM|nr:hypothetical protein D8B20_10140 [Pantoea soli]
MQLTGDESNSLYIVKAIGIIAVVLGHYADFLTVYKPYYFHMPLFFFIGGITLRDKADSIYIMKVIKSNAIYLVTRYIIIGVITIGLIHLGLNSFPNPFAPGLFGNIKAAYSQNMHNNQLFLVAWFLVAYTLAIALCSVIVLILNRSRITTKTKKVSIFLISIFFGFISISVLSHDYNATKNQIYNILAQVMCGSMYVLFGYLLRRVIFSVRSLSILLFISILLPAIIDIFKATPMIMSWSKYNDGFVLTTIIACMIIYSIFIISNVFSNALRRESIIIMIGKNTRPIMTWHLSIFIFLDIFISFTKSHRPLNSYGVFDHFHNEYSMCVYVLSGVLIPLFFVHFNFIHMIMTWIRDKQTNEAN